MSVFSKNSKKKLVLTLACASVLGGKAQAINSGVKDVKSEQAIGAIGGARNQPKKINWHKIAKIGGFSIAGLAVLQTIHSIVGGVTDSKAGSYSIGRAIRNHLKKSEQISNQNVKTQDNNNDEKSVESIKNINNGKSEKVNNFVFDDNYLNTNGKLPFNFKVFLMLQNINENTKEWELALSSIKTNKFIRNKNCKWKDLLEVIISDKISEKDAKTLKITKKNSFVSIWVTLNSVDYRMELLEHGANIYMHDQRTTWVGYQKKVNTLP